jgi:hypothetical protein
MLDREILRRRENRADPFPEPEGELIEVVGHSLDELIVVTRVDEQDQREEGGAGEFERNRRAHEVVDDHWKAAESTILNGDADEFLSEVERLEDRPAVLTAIEERRAELTNEST